MTCFEIGVLDSKDLSSGRVLDNKDLFSGRVPDNKKLFSGNLPDNTKLSLTGNYLNTCLIDCHSVSHKIRHWHIVKHTFIYDMIVMFCRV